MKILWVCPFFLHPTNRGGQIRTLGTLRELNQHHEVHFAALNPPENTEGPARSKEYCSRHVAIPHLPPKRGTLAIVPQLLASLFNPVPLAVARYASADLRRAVETLIRDQNYDVIVCDFLAAAPNMPDMRRSVLFQHNVETTICERHVAQARSWLKRGFYAMQASKMRAYEARICQAAQFVIAVSSTDADRIKSMFQVDRVLSVPTGVDVDFYRRNLETPITADLIFSGSMDWLANVDAMEYFLREVFPLIRQKRPETTITIAGRSPAASLVKAAEEAGNVTVTGTVPDIRPYLWSARVSIIPLRIGGGTRLKVYECMAAGLPIVSTTIGAEGLDYMPGKDLLLADTPAEFAEACLRLLDDSAARKQMASNAQQMVEERFSWKTAARAFESILEQCSRSVR